MSSLKTFKGSDALLLVGVGSYYRMMLFPLPPHISSRYLCMFIFTRKYTCIYKMRWISQSNWVNIKLQRKTNSLKKKYILYSSWKNATPITDISHELFVCGGLCCCSTWYSSFQFLKPELSFLTEAENGRISFLSVLLSVRLASWHRYTTEET